MPPLLQELRPELIQELAYNNALNSKAFLIEHADLPIEFVGNRTECALLMLTKKWGVDYKQVCLHRSLRFGVMRAASLHGSAK
jgi:Ca2+-transporting ATPase